MNTLLLSMDRADLGPLPAFVIIMHLPHLHPEANSPQWKAVKNISESDRAP